MQNTEYELPWYGGRENVSEEQNNKYNATTRRCQDLIIALYL